MTPDQYRREGAEAMWKAMLVRLDDLTCEDPIGAIRAIDVDEVLAKMGADTEPRADDVLRAINPDGWPTEVFAGKACVRFPNGIQSGNWQSRGDDSHIRYVRYDLQSDAVARLVEAARALQPYLDWTIGPESPGYHPTMASAAAAFKEALAAMEASHDRT